MTLNRLGDDQHPTVRLVEGVRTLLAEHAGSPVWTMSTAELAEQLPALAVVMNELNAVKLAMLREADRHQVGDPLGYASTAAWWANVTRSTKREAHRQVALAARLDEEEHAPTADALAAGEVSTEQAAVIMNATDALPTDLVSGALRRDAEQHLITLAAHHDPRELRFLGRRILEVVAPEIGEEHERKLLEAEERDAASTAYLHMYPDGAGSYVGRFKVPVLAGEMLARHLNALAAPRHRAAEGPLDPATELGRGRLLRPQRLGRAFIEYLETRPDDTVPHAGGLPATIVVTMTMDDLIGKGGVATLDNGERITASEARRLACEAGIIPAVLGSPSQVLDLGRKARFHTQPQRIAIGLKTGNRCAVEGCDATADRCHVHHLDAWSSGGGTSVERGVLLCTPHHSRAHDERYQLKSAKNGRVTFSRRT